MEPRYRERDLSKPLETTTVHVTEYDGTDEHHWLVKKEYDNVYTYQPYYDLEVMTDVVVDNFYARMKKGEIFNNPLTKTRTIIEDTPGSFYRAYIGDYVEYGGDEGYEGKRLVGLRPVSSFSTDLIELPDPSIETMKSLAVAEAFARANVSEFQALNFVAEGEKSIASLVAIAQRFIRIGKRIKRLQFRALKREFSRKELENRWMEVRYAIRPLVIDTKNIVKAINKAENEDRMTFRGGESFSSSDSDEYNVGSDSFEVLADRTMNYSVKVRAGVLAKVDVDHFCSTYGIDMPVELMWEICPFSFIFDWFFNVADTISAWTPKFGISTLASWVTIKEVSTQSINLRSARNLDPGFNIENQAIVAGSYAKTVFKTTRVPDPKRSIIPSFRLNLNVAKLIDLVIIGKRFRF